MPDEKGLSEQMALSKKAKTILLIVGIVVLAFIAGGSVLSYLLTPKLITANGFAMSTYINQQIYMNDSRKADALASDMMTELAVFEDRLSMYRAQSEISSINDNAGVAPVAVSEETYALIKKAIGYCEQSDGMFDITIAPVTKAWGINSDAPRVPSQEELQALKELVNYRDVLLDDTARTVMLKKSGQAIDLGAVAKGEACNIAHTLYAKRGTPAGLISIGGNIMVMGKKPGGKDFVVGVRDPRGAPNEVIATVRLTDEVLSTSGDYERFFKQGGKSYHHIMDPSTASPAETDLMSVTVICEDGMYADFLSTWLFMLGKGGALARFDDLNAGVVAVDKEKNVYVSPRLADALTPALNKGYTFHIG